MLSRKGGPSSWGADIVGGKSIVPTTMLSAGVENSVLPASGVLLKMQAIMLPSCAEWWINAHQIATKMILGAIRLSPRSRDGIYI